jgi:hypothetical protein
MHAIIYTNSTSPRVDYIFSTLINALGFDGFELTTDLNLFQTRSGFKINYSPAKFSEEETWIAPVSLLFEAGIKNQNVHCFNVDKRTSFFRTTGDFPFDIFAASFYLLSRYEEYLPHKTDMYGRYAHENSLAFKQGFLNLPLINIWLADLQEILSKKNPSLKLLSRSFTFIPTYDIDIAWSYKHKGFFRNAGGLLKSIFKGQWTSVVERIAVLAGKRKDPFDSFEWLNDLHSKKQLSPVYFLLLAEKAKGYDKNILPVKTALKKLVKEHSSLYHTGIHPSWRSGDHLQFLAKEITTLKDITNKPVEKSRQHYIRMTMPATYRRLIDAGIKEDYSMGYGSINGFRASYCLPYKWYDLEKEQQTPLTIFPFCFMDANLYFEQGYSSDEALKEMEHYHNITKQVNGMLITIWHNHFFGTDKMFKGWREVYNTMINRICKEFKGSK